MKPVNPIFNLLTKLKDITNKFSNTNVVHNIPCNNYTKFYIGFTDTNVKARVYHHKLTLKPNKKVTPFCRLMLKHFNLILTVQLLGADILLKLNLDLLKLYVLTN